jgi:hypothetical protein
MKKYFAAPAAFVLLALSLSGCVWYHRGWNGGNNHGPGGSGYQSGGSGHGGYNNRPGY